MKQYDVIIIGGGLGGLTAGAKLAKDGKKVLLVEQHHQLGGCATTFRRKEYTWDVGLHAMDGLDDDDRKKRIFEELGVSDKVQFITVPDFYRIKNKRLDIVVPSSAREAAKLLIEKFPDEQRGIKKFFKKIKSIQLESNRIPMERWKFLLTLPFFPFLFPTIFFYTFKTVGSFLDQEISSNDLKIILCSNIFFYHDDPYSMSMIYFGIAQSSYFNGGSHYIRGGSQKLSDYLGWIIKKNGGDIKLNNYVLEIITEKNKAVGIKYISKLDKGKTQHTAYSKRIIANNAIPNIPSMLKKGDRKRVLLSKKNKNMIKPCSLISIYIGFKKEPKKLMNKNYCTFFLGDNIRKINHIQNNSRDDFSERSFFFTDYSQIDSGLTPKGKSVGTISTVDYFADWENLTEDEYRKKKDKVAHTLFKRLEEVIPGITDEIECYEVGTPKTIQKYTCNPEGIAYGFAQIPRQSGIFRLSNKSPVKNLYFASAWTNPGGGFTGTIFSGWFCAHEVISSLKPLFCSRCNYLKNDKTKRTDV